MLSVELAAEQRIQGILTMFKDDVATHGGVYSIDELRDLVEVSNEYGELKTEKAHTLTNVLAFDQTPVERIMISRGDAITLSLDESSPSVAQP